MGLLTGAAAGRAGGVLAAAAGFAGAGRLTGALAVDWRATGCLGAEGVEALEGCGALAATGAVADGLAATGLLGAAAVGLTGDFAGGATGASAFLTDRMALPAGGLAGAAGCMPFLSRPRILPASVSLMELLWLFAAMDSFSAASSTSLLSRPRSLDNS